MTHSRSIAALVLVVSSALSGCIITSDDPGATLTVENDSSYVLIAVYIAQVQQADWGPNLVPDVLYPGEAVTAYGFPCGYYDVLVTDETKLDCTLTDVHLCFSDNYWYVTDVTLDACAFRKRLGGVPTRPESSAPISDGGVGP